MKAAEFVREAGEGVLDRVIATYDAALRGRGYKKVKPWTSETGTMVLPYINDTPEGRRYFTVEFDPDDPIGTTFWNKMVDDPESHMPMPIDDGSGEYQVVLSAAKQAETRE